jgi:hypothetical protein
MDSGIGWKTRRARDSKRLEALLDKLVALRMDFEPVGVAGTAASQVLVSLELTTGACEILRSAVADVRNIIHQNDALIDERGVRSNGVEPHLGADLSISACRGV